MTASRKSFWLNAYQSAWRIFGLSNGLCSQFGRKVYWLPSGFQSTR